MKNCDKGVWIEEYGAVPAERGEELLMQEEAREAVKVFRRKHPKITAAWKKFLKEDDGQ